VGRSAFLLTALGAVTACSFAPGKAGNAIDASPGQHDARPGTDSAVTRHDAAEQTDGPATKMDAKQVATPLDCLDAMQNFGVTASGTVSIDPDGAGGNGAFDVYCDMTTSGGGWTLAWVYGFTNYGDFMNGNNAVTPRPTWSSPSVSDPNRTPNSTTPPTAPDLAGAGAIDFTQWAQLGTDFLVLSNINNNLTCTAGTGTIAPLQQGTVSCTLLQPLVVTISACKTVVPTQIHTNDPAGVGLYTGSGLDDTYYFWEGLTDTGNWPTHDPCGGNEEFQKQNVPDAFGSLYLRRHQ
jgi:hypothetical protein